MDYLEFPESCKEENGSLYPGLLKLTNQFVTFKNGKTGKLDEIQSADIESIKWQRLGAGYGPRFMLRNGELYRFGGFTEVDHDKLGKFFSSNFELDMKNKDLSLKGWNWGEVKFDGSVLSFEVENTEAFEVPLGNVSQCSSAKNEVTLEFHHNDEAPVSLTKMRFHIPTDPSSEIDRVTAFMDNVMAKASINEATSDAIVIFKDLKCFTPRGRYDVKIFLSFIQVRIQFSGKTYDYRILLTTVLRLFLLPHRDGRQMFFVLSLDPPIEQGQTLYHYLILLFSKEEETTVELSLSESNILEKYEDKLQKTMSGRTFEVLSRVMKALVQRKITVPGTFKGHSGTHAVTCSYQARNGLLYPLEGGIIFVHKLPVHIRFEEIVFVNFARSGGSTRSLDFEIETKNGLNHIFSSIEKEEYPRLYDFVNSKELRIRNKDKGFTTKEKKPVYNEDDMELVDSDVEDEPDSYLQRVKDKGRVREQNEESFTLPGSGSEVATSSARDEDDDDDDYRGSSKV